MNYEPVIGLEIHAELTTRSKMFCGCANLDLETDDPNSNICPVCTGLPGAMPVINRRALEQAMMAGLAFGCQIATTTAFARKNYFYPDLPKGYQISQHEKPLSQGGALEIIGASGEVQRIGIRQIHLEEDTAKLYHFDEYALVDFNRSGVPLLEIVSEPDLYSAEDAQIYAGKVREILRYLGINSGDMEKGALRLEANVSVRPVGSSELGTRVEIKNLNSFRSMVDAITYEIGRQSQRLDAGQAIVQETLGWDEGAGKTLSQRRKEFAHDYRYFPEPDLPPVGIEAGWLAEIEQMLPELPDAKRDRFVEQYGLTRSDAERLTGSRYIADYFEETVRLYQGEAQRVVNWLVRDFFAQMNQFNVSAENISVPAVHFAGLLNLITQGSVSRSSGREILAEMFATGKEAAVILREKNMQQISDQDALQPIIQEVLAGSPQQMAEYLGGKESLADWFMGQVMRKTRGQANPAVVRQLLGEALQAVRESGQ